MEAYYHTFRIGIDDQHSPFLTQNREGSSVELLTVPFPLLEFIFPDEGTEFEATGYQRILNVAVGRIQLEPIKTYLSADYRAFGFFLDPVSFFEATGLGADSLSDTVPMREFLVPVLRELERTPCRKPGKLVRPILQKWVVSRKKRTCYRVIDQFLDEVHSLPYSRIQEVEGTLSFSGKHLRSTFRSVFGITPKQYLQLLQLQGVLRDMSDTRKFSLTDIALRNGYYDQSHFNMVFRRFAGLAPGQFRQAYIPYAWKYKNTIVL